MPSIYQANYDMELATKHSQMSIAMGCLIFNVYFDEELRKMNVLDDIMKKLKNIYIPGYGAKSMNRDSDIIFENAGDESFNICVEKIDKRTRKIHLKKKKMTEEESKFEQLLHSINACLFYLSNVKFQSDLDQGISCELGQPVEIVPSLIDVFKFRDDLMAEYSIKNNELSITKI